MFVRWSGDLISHKQERVSFIATKNIHATGYFYDGSLDAVPCWDKIKGVMNPLRNMSVAATKSGSFYAGTYGYTRNAGKKKHAGLDLNASPGTPMFAMYSGIVHYLETRRKGTSEDRDYGNEFVIQTVINSDTLYIQYAHLDATTPIAINPETQETYKEGDHVSIGDLICYSGKTGNARGTDVPNKHLHLGVSTDWKKDHRKISWIDPLPYINGTVNVDSIENNHGRVNSIKCD